MWSEAQSRDLRLSITLWSAKAALKFLPEVCQRTNLTPVEVAEQVEAIYDFDGGASDDPEDRALSAAIDLAPRLSWREVNESLASGVRLLAAAADRCGVDSSAADRLAVHLAHAREMAPALGSHELELLCATEVLLARVERTLAIGQAARAQPRTQINDTQREVLAFLPPSAEVPLKTTDEVMRRRASNKRPTFDRSTVERAMRKLREFGLVTSNRKAIARTPAGDRMVAQ